MCEKRLKELLEIKQRLIDIKIERTIEQEQKELLSTYNNLFLSLDDALEKEAKYLADKKTRKVDLEKIGKELGNELIQMIDKEIKR
jgi:hypothetical protein